MAKFGPPRNQTNYISLKGIDRSYPKMYFLLNFSHCVKSHGHFCQILALFNHAHLPNMVCHMAQDASLKKFLFCPNSTFNIRKSHKLSGGKALYFRSYPALKAISYENTILYRIYQRKCDSYELLCYLTRYTLTFTASLKVIDSCQGFCKVPL